MTWGYRCSRKPARRSLVAPRGCGTGTVLCVSPEPRAFDRPNFQNCTPDRGPTISATFMSEPAPLSRTPGTVVVRSADAIEILSHSGTSAVRLNETAKLVLLLCDGRHSAADIEHLLTAAYPDEAADVARDLTAILATLKARRLITETRDARTSLKVGFANFWPQFNVATNYFVAGLVSYFDVIVINDGTADLDVLFCANYSSVGRCPALDGQRTKKVFVALDDEPPNFGEFDYAYSCQQLASERHYRLPSWVMFTDWRAYAQAAPRLGGNRLPAAYDPQVAGRHLRNVLWGGDLPDRGSARGSAAETCMASSRHRHRWRSAGHTEGSKKLTIGMATHDDFDGLYFTVQAIRLYHPEVAPDIEIVIVDNDPDGPCGPAVRALQDTEGCRYVAFDHVQSTTIKDLVFREACGEFVLCVDSHVLVVAGALRRLIDFLEAHPECRDLLQGPMLRDDPERISTHFDPVWSRGMYGTWGHDPRADDPDAPPFEIGMQGTGLFACRREAWLGFSPRFTGFGGEEGYIHEKFRQAGRRTLCLPFLRWIHRFQRPRGYSYANRWEDRVRNYLIGHHELGLDAADVERHFSEILGRELFDRIAAEVRHEMASALFEFEAAYLIDTASDPLRWQDQRDRLKVLGIHRPRRLLAVDPTTPAQICRVEAHGHILEFARCADLRSVIVFEGDELLPEAALPHIEASIDRLRSRPWQILVIGVTGQNGHEAATDAGTLCRGGEVELVRTFAIAYHSRAYQGASEALESYRQLGAEALVSARPPLEEHLSNATELLVVPVPGDLG
jgi:hypothetical protein